MGLRLAIADRAAYLRRALRSQKRYIDMHKRQVVFCPNQVVHDLVVVINHHLFPDVSCVPTYLSSRAAEQENDSEAGASFHSGVFSE